MKRPDMIDFSVSFSFRKKSNTDAVVKQLLKLPFVMKFCYEEIEICPNDTRYELSIEGSGSLHLKLLSNIVKTVEFRDANK